MSVCYNLKASFLGSSLTSERMINLASRQDTQRPTGRQAGVRLNGQMRIPCPDKTREHVAVLAGVVQPQDQMTLLDTLISDLASITRDLAETDRASLQAAALHRLGSLAEALGAQGLAADCRKAQSARAAGQRGWLPDVPSVVACVNVLIDAIRDFTPVSKDGTSRHGGT